MTAMQRLFHRGRLFRRNEDGSVAVEFSLLAIPVTILVIGIIEVAVMFASASSLQGGISDALRVLRTGQAQQSLDNTPEEVFIQTLCEHSILIRCGSLQYDVRPLTSFSDANTTITIDDEGQMVDAGFVAPASREVVMVRVLYSYELMTPLIAQFLGNPGNTRRFIATAVIETEPWEF